MGEGKIILIHEGKIILIFRFLGIKTEGGTAALYHITAKSAMGEGKIILTKEK